MLNNEVMKAARMLEKEREKELVEEANRRKFIEKYFGLGNSAASEEKFGGFLVESVEEKITPSFSPTLEEELGLLLSELNFRFHIFWKVIKNYIAIEEDLNYVQKKKTPFYVDEMTGKYYWTFEDIYNEYQIVKSLLRFLCETLGEIHGNNSSKKMIAEKVSWKYPRLTPIIFEGFGVKQRLDFLNENLCSAYNSMLQIAFELCASESIDKNRNFIKEFLSEFEKISKRLDRMMNKLNKQILRKWFWIDKVTSIKELITDILNVDKDNTNEKNSLIQFVYSGVIIFLLHFFFHHFYQISNGFENVWFGDLLDVMEGINNDIYFTIVTLTFTILSLTSVLSTKTNEVYWVDAVELKLMHPRWFNFTSLAAGLIIDLIFATCCKLGNIAYLLFMSYFIAISLLIILTYRMIDVYFGKGKTKERLKRQFLIDKELGETGRKRYKYNLNKLKVRTKQHIENLEEIYIVENLQLLLDAKEIKAVNDLLIYIKNNAPDIFHDIFQSLKINDYNDHLSVVYDVFYEQIDSQHSNPAIIEFCVEFIAESFLEEVRKMIISSVVRFRSTHKTIYSNKDMLKPFANEFYIMDKTDEMKRLETSIVEHNNNILKSIKNSVFLYKAVKEKNAFNYRTDAVRQSIENNRWDILALFSEAYSNALKKENWLQIPGGENDIVQLIVNIVLGKSALELTQLPEVYGKDVVLRRNRCIEVIEEGVREYAFLERDLRAMLGFIKNLGIDRDKEIAIIEECMKAGYDIFEVYDIVDMNSCREYQHCWVIPYGYDIENLKSADLAYLTGELLYEEGKLVDVPHQKIANPYAC